MGKLKISLLLFLAFTSFSIIFSSLAFAGRYDRLIKNLDNFMGNGAAIKRSDSRGFSAVGDNGNRFRMDYDGHGYKPHAHLETPSPNGKLGDAPGTPHHIYFKD